MSCDRCGQEFKSDYVSSLGGHKQGNVISVIPATCTDSEITRYECSVCGESFDVKTDSPKGHKIVNGICSNCGKVAEDCIESAHDYANSTDKSWTIFKSGASSIDVTFSDLTFVESYCDYIYIYDADSNEVGKYTGGNLASKTITVKGNTVKIRLKTDSSVVKYGFAVSNIKANF